MRHERVYGRTLSVPIQMCHEYTMKHGAAGCTTTTAYVNLHELCTHIMKAQVSPMAYADKPDLSPLLKREHVRSDE